MANATKTTAKWNPDFELAILRQLFADPALVARVVGHLKPESFANPEVKMLVECVVEHHKRHGAGPTPTVALQMVRGMVEAGKVKTDRLTACGEAIETAWGLPAPDGGFVREAILGEARKDAVWQALDDGFKNYKSGDYDRIAEQFAEAAQIGKVDAGPGTDLQKSLQRRTKDRREGKKVTRWPTGVGSLDDIIRGGLAASELGVVLGVPKSGKSMFMNQIALSAMLMGGTVYYYTLEMTEREVSDRMDAAISQTPTKELDKRFDYVHTLVDDFMTERQSVFVVKQFPSYDTTIQDIEAHMRMMRVEQSTTPSIVIVDSGDLCSSSRSSEGRYEELGSVYSEMKGMAARWQVPVWTPSWARRDAVAKQRVTMADIADSFKKVAIADVGIAICMTDDEQKSSTARLFVAYCRYATSGVETDPMRTAFDIGRFAREGAAEESDG